MSKFLALNQQDKQDALLVAQEQHPTKLPAYIIEKDFWVCLTLKVLYSGIAPQLKAHCHKPFIFKGGTSLSKCFGLINRMSEDIDLSFSLSLLGSKPITRELAPSGKKQRKQAATIEANAAKFINEFLFSELEQQLQRLDSAIRVEIESKQPLNIAIYYPKNLPESDYGAAVQARVLLETGGRSENLPDESVSISHMLGEAIEELQDEAFSVLVLSPQRTIIEKVFGVHENNYRETVAAKHARHLYDIVQIDKKHPNWCENRALFMSNIDFAQLYYAKSTALCDSTLAGPLHLVPKNEEMYQKYLNDWLKMADMFPDATLPYHFDDLLKKIQIIEDKANRAFY
ncbi:MAG: hypothetical protein ACI8WB_002911, partial [Phenylobacterium sp.]